MVKVFVLYPKINFNHSLENGNIRKIKIDFQELVNCIMRASNGMRFRVEQPRVMEIQYDRTNNYTDKLEEVMSRSNPQLMMFIVPNNNLDRYSAIKKKCCVDRPCLSQVVLTKTIFSKGRPNLTAATKIAIQLNCKLGGAGWTVEIPTGNIMVAGFDVCHDKTTRGRDFGEFLLFLLRFFFIIDSFEKICFFCQFSF